MAYHRTHQLDTKIVRIFNTYGPRMRKVDGRAIPAFIEQSYANKPITVFGTGKQTRSFCYISDLVEGVYRLMNSNVNTPINIGSPEEMNIIELARMIIKLTGSKSKIVFEPLPVDDPKVRQPEITLAKMLLTWQPTISLRDGLRKTIEWFKENNMGSE
jgi:dTDP-glucose 4,6-dehydratase